MSEEVLISFTPTQWKYYYDTIKIVGPDINVTIPIHGYIIIKFRILCIFHIDLYKKLKCGYKKITNYMYNT